MKKNNILGFLILSIFAFGCFFIPKQQIKVYANSTNKFIIQSYGDSISYGEALQNLNDAYPNVFANNYVEKFNAEFYANGVSGYTTDDLLDLLQPYKNRTATDIEIFDDTDVVLLCIGANNVLGPALTNLTDYITDNMSETEYRNILQLNVNNFIADYPEILKIFQGKKIITMTIYNPYKYSTLKDVNIDPSLGSYSNIATGMLNNYDVKFQKMIDISMEYLTIINNQIRSYANENIFVVDIWNLFSSFNKSQYLNYINTNPSNVTISYSDVTSLLQGDFNNILTKLYTHCDPHPTKSGHNVIAQEHLKNFKIFNLTKTNSPRVDNSILSVNSFLNSNYTYKFYKIENNTKILLKETNENSITIANSKIENASELFVEVYKNSQLLDTSTSISINQTEKQSVDARFIVIFVTITLVLMCVIIPISVLVYTKKSKRRF